MTKFEIFCEFLRANGHVHYLRPYKTEDDPAIEWFFWVVDVPTQDLCKVEDSILDSALDIWGEEPLPLMAVTAGPEKSKLIRQMLVAENRTENLVVHLRSSSHEGVYGKVSARNHAPVPVHGLNPMKSGNGAALIRIAV